MQMQGAFLSHLWALHIPLQLLSTHVYPVNIQIMMQSRDRMLKLSAVKGKQKKKGKKIYAARHDNAKVPYGLNVQGSQAFLLSGCLKVYVTAASPLHTPLSP